MHGLMRSVSTRYRTANSSWRTESSEALTDSTTSYRVAAELVPEPAAELVQLPPAGSVGGGVAWRALCCGWLRG